MRTLHLVSFILLSITLSQAALPQAPPAVPPEWRLVADALHRSGSMQPGEVFKVGMPRSDLHVTVDGLAIQPALALGSWLAFKRTADKTVVMGDLVLTLAEVPQVMQALQSGGVSITALHNHLLGESPRIMYMHIAGEGDAVALARALQSALALTGTPAPAPAAASAPKLDLDVAAIEQALGRKGKPAGVVLQFAVPRAEAVSEGGMEVPPAMGTATAINFQSSGNGRAAATGDFVLTAGEVNPVLQALTANGIAVTAVHSHMLDEQPRLFFLHFWGDDEALKLARGLRAALDKVNTAKP